MSEEQISKILDVMHTLSCIRDGRIHDAKISANACYQVLQKVLDIEAHQRIESQQRKEGRG